MENRNRVGMSIEDAVILLGQLNIDDNTISDMALTHFSQYGILPQDIIRNSRTYAMRSPSATSSENNSTATSGLTSRTDSDIDFRFDELNPLDFMERFINSLGRNQPFEDVKKIIKKQTLDSLELRMVNDNEEDKQCAFCLDEYNEGDIIRILPCKHDFHSVCCDKWLLEKSHLCPLCKQSAGEYECK